MGGPAIRPPRVGEPAAAADSRLRSVFLQHRLLAGWRHVPGLPDEAAHRIVAQVVDRLLAAVGGLEPLLAMERGGVDAADAARTAAIAVALARAAGWPTAALADLGVAAFVVDVGRAVEPTDAARAGMRWLLGRGVDDLWLRCAAIARLAPPHDGPAGVDGAAAVVRLALVARDALDRAGGRDGWQRDAAFDAAGAPPELVATLRQAFESA
jgi:hypothetical protein